MTEIARIINDYLLEHRIRPPQLAGAMTDALAGHPYGLSGITRQAVHYWTTGETAHPDPMRLEWIAQYAAEESLRQLARDLLEAIKSNNGKKE